MSLRTSMSLFRDFMRGAGFHRSLASPTASLDADMQKLASDESLPRPASAPSWFLPTVNFVAGENVAYQEALLKIALPEDQERMRAYLTKVTLGAAAITGVSICLNFDTSYVSQDLLDLARPTLAIAALSLLTRFGPGYGSAPTNVAVSNFAERLDSIDEQAARTVGHEVEDMYTAPDPATVSAPNKIGMQRHVILRGFSLHIEVEAFEALLRKTGLGNDAIRLSIWRPKTPWHFHLSATFYLCLVLGLPAAGRKLTPEDSASLHKFANSLSNDKRMEGVRLLAAGEIAWDAYSRRADRLGPKETEILLVSILRLADIVLTTPALSYQAPANHDKERYKTNPFAEFKSKSVWAAIDEAGGMSRADALTILGNTCLPSVLGGDHQQLPPFVASPINVKQAGNAVNRHAADARISALAWYMMSGLPVYRMRVQLRMARGQFSLAGQSIYKDLPWTYGESTDVKLPQHEPGHLLERFARGRFPNLKASPAGELMPVFIHCPGQAVIESTTGSKCNPVQTNVALDFLAGLVQDTGVDPARIVIITPYAWSAALINKKIKRSYPSLQGMPAVVTVDSFQGREADIIMYVMVATSKTGPGFTADRQRLNVAMTRHRCGFVIVCDINVVGEVRGKRKRKNAHQKPKSVFVQGPNGETFRMSPGVLWDVCVELNRAGRVTEANNAVKVADEVEDELAEEGEKAEVGKEEEVEEEEDVEDEEAEPSKKKRKMSSPK
ncbi:hypothetical protein Daus18300_009246 [Diaporthe australafricana]|uniref:DNA2/NAM7 helicase-like C-terminal domain-containing protein n=1 Tax=Diaporthe australafricana TaxID=127596 RepID=A0ABR3WF72_9PEZI